MQHHIFAIKQAHKEFNVKSQKLQDRERACVLTHSVEQSDVTYMELLEACRLLELLLYWADWHFLDKELYFCFKQGDKNGNLLAILVPQQSSD